MNVRMVLAAGLLMGCAAIAQGHVNPEPPAIRILAQGPYSAVEKSEQRVVRSQAELEKLWEALHGRPSKDRLALPRIDWSKEMVLAVMMGTRSTAGFRTSIRDAKVSGDKLVVTYAEIVPGRDAILAQVITHPYFVAAVKRWDKQVEWKKEAPTEVAPALRSRIP